MADAVLRSSLVQKSDVLEKAEDDEVDEAMDDSRGIILLHPAGIPPLCPRSPRQVSWCPRESRLALIQCSRLNEWSNADQAEDRKRWVKCGRNGCVSDECNED